MKLFITCLVGLEELLVSELKELGFDNTLKKYAGVEIETDELGVYKINYLSRVAIRVLLQLKTFRCTDRNSLYNHIKSFNWSDYFTQPYTLSIDANIHQVPAIQNSHFAGLVVKDAICDQLKEKNGTRPNIDVKDPDIQLNLFIQNDQAVISFDTSLAPLYKRGYRIEAIEAPIQESLAAAILKMANFSDTDILLDPCAGSGTFLIEAAMMRTKTPAGFFRKKWGFMNAPFFNHEQWTAFKESENSKRIPLEKDKIFGIELNKNHARVMRSQLKFTGFNQVEVVQGDFREFNPKILPNLIIANPPFGKRMGEEEGLISLYRSLGDFMKLKTSKPAKGYIYTASVLLSKQIGLRSKSRFQFKSSGMDAHLLEFELY